MEASDVITRAGRTLYDVGKVRWTEPELLDHITDAQRQVVAHRPDSNAVNEAVALADGTKQALPATAMRFLRAVRNMGSDGATPGRPIRPASRSLMDADVADWHSELIEGVAVEHYIFDDIDPRTFYVQPGPTNVAGTPVHVEVIYAARPAAVTATTDTLDLPDHFMVPVTDWVLYRAFGKDADFAGTAQRANQHLQSFANELGVAMQAGFTHSGADGRDPGGQG